MPKRAAIPFLALVAGALPVLATSAPAAAQVPADAVYADVKEIIEELMTTEVSQTVATHLACLSGRQTIDIKTNPSLTAIDVTTDLVASKGKAGPKDVYVELEAVKYFPRLLQAIYDKQFSSVRQTALGEAAGLLGDVAYELTKDKPVAQARAAALKAQVSLTAQHTSALLNNEKQLDFTPLKDVQGRGGWRNVVPLVAPPKFDPAFEICATNLGLLLSNNGLGHATTALDTECQGTTRDEYACDMAYALEQTVENDSKAAEGYVVRALADFVLEIALQQPAVPATDKTVDKSAIVNEPNEQLTTMIAIISTLLASTDPTDKAVAAAEASIKNAFGKQADQLPLRTLTDEWKALHLTNSKSLAAGVLADATGGVAALVADGCKLAPNGKACKFFEHEQAILGNGSAFLSVIQLARNGSELDAAQLAVDELFTDLKEFCSKEEYEDESACELFPYYKRFADAVVVYVVQAHTEGSPSDDARAVLRSATVDMVQQIGVNGGIDLPIISSEVFRPDFSLRYDWSPSFVNVNPGARSVASVSWLKLRGSIFRNEMGYSAISLAVVDVIAPLSELAARNPASSYANGSLLWWNFIAPRTDVEFGIPALSKHLLVGGGVSYRLVAPRQTVAPTMTTPASYEYQGCLTHSWWENCFEFGVFAKYAL